MINVQGVKVDEKAIAAGVYKMIPANDKACMVYGMLPAKWMEMLEKLLKDKLAKVQFKDENITEADMKACGLQIKKTVVNEIMTAICAEILKIATEDGICVV